MTTTTQTKEVIVLKFSPAKSNAKLVKLLPKLKGFLKYLKIPAVKVKFYTFSKLSGTACPYAKECKSEAVKTADGMRIVDGPDTVFRCFSASQEVLFPTLYAQRNHNLQSILGCKNSVVEMYKLIRESIPSDANVVRIHIGGDFVTSNEFLAWCRVAQLRSDVLFYAYTKSLPFWIKHSEEIPSNFVLTASYGGYKDSLISEFNLPAAKVVDSEAEAEMLGLEVDHDDSHAINPRKRKSFALVIHGQQMKGGAKLSKILP